MKKNKPSQLSEPFFFKRVLAQRRKLWAALASGVCLSVRLGETALTHFLVLSGPLLIGIKAEIKN